jgi:hypothetical protein
MPTTKRIETYEFMLGGDDDHIQKTITLTTGSSLLLKSISYIIKDTKIHNSTTATCLSRSVKPMVDICPMDYNLSLKLSMCLTQQLAYLVKHGYSFYLFDPVNVVMFDDNQFVYISTLHLTQINESKLKIWYPFTRSFFLSPEMKEIVCLPALVDVATSYYSLGMLVMFSLFADQIASIGEGSIHYETFVDMLGPIHSTKLYWFILRSIKQEPQERVLLFC